MLGYSRQLAEQKNTEFLLWPNKSYNTQNQIINSSPLQCKMQSFNIAFYYSYVDWKPQLMPGKCLTLVILLDYIWNAIYARWDEPSHFYFSSVTKVITISVARLYVLAKSIYTPFKKQAFIKGKCTPSDSYKYLVHLKAYLFSSQTWATRGL